MTSNSFDDKAATWDDDPAKVERSRVVAREIRDAVPLVGTERLLEYGAVRRRRAPITVNPERLQEFLDESSL